MRILNPKTVINFLQFEKEERAGYLLKKRSEHKGSFKKRYFVACGNILAYFEKKTDKDPLGILILEGHVIEILDDLTMALRFPNLGDNSRCYVLRSDTTEDIEQWMRVLSRSGIDFFILTLEDLEDQLNALNVVQKSVRLNPPNSDNADAHISKKHVQRSNPFNRLSMGASELPKQPPARPSRLPLDGPPTKPVTPVPKLVQKSESSPSSVPHSTDHLQWVLSQSWDEIHGRVKTNFANRSAVEADLIDLS